MKEISTARAVGQIRETMIRLPLKSGARENGKTRVFGINGFKERSLTLVKNAAAIRPDYSGIPATLAEADSGLECGLILGRIHVSF